MSQNKKTAPKRRTTPGRVAAIQAAQIQAVKAAKAAKARQTAKPAGTRSVAKATKKSAPKSSAVGRFLASSLAGLIPGGGALSGIAGEAGGWLGDKIGTALGLGEYDVAHIKQNSIINEGQTPPYMHDRNDLSVIRHREMLGDVYSSDTPGAFSVQNFAINPGLASSYPWMSMETKGYREWVPLGIVYEFKSNTGYVGGVNPQLGMVVMATDYNAFDTDPFHTKMEMENNLGTTSANSTQSFYHAVECMPELNQLGRFYTRTSALPPNQPPQLYDLGTFAIASVGCPTATQNLGELWCTIEIGLSKATIQNQTEDAAPSDMWVTPGGNSVDLFYLPLASPFNSLGGSLGPANGRYSFPSAKRFGEYLFTFYLSGLLAGNQLLGPLTTSLFNCLNVTTMNQNGLNPPINTPVPYAIGGSTTANGGLNQMIQMRFRITGPNSWFQISIPGSWTANTGCYIIVSPISEKVGFAPYMLEHFNSGFNSPRRHLHNDIQPPKTVLPGNQSFGGPIHLRQMPFNDYGTFSQEGLGATPRPGGTQAQLQGPRALPPNRPPEPHIDFVPPQVPITLPSSHNQPLVDVALGTGCSLTVDYESTTRIPIAYHCSSHTEGDPACSIKSGPIPRDHHQDHHL